MYVIYTMSKRKRPSKGLRKDVNKLKKAVFKRGEVKRVSGAVVDADCFDTATVDSLLDIITAGTGDVNYTGARMSVLSLKFRGMLQQDTANDAITHLTRVVLLMDKTGNTAPTWTDVYASAAVFAGREYDADWKRFKVLYDKTFKTSKNTAGESMEKEIFDHYIKFKAPIVVDFNTANANYPKNGLWLMFLSTAATTVLDFSYDWDVRFVDN